MPTRFLSGLLRGTTTVVRVHSATSDLVARGRDHWEDYRVATSVGRLSFTVVLTNSNSGPKQIPADPAEDDQADNPDMASDTSFSLVV